jgi:outer membrane protein
MDGSHPLTIEECYARALAKSESVAQQGELAKQAGEKMFQAVGGLLPSISGSAGYQREEETSRSSGRPVPDEPTVKITATQPLFRGGREYFGVRQAGKNAEAQKAAARQSELTLFRDLAQGFFAVISAEQDLAGMETQMKAYDERIRDLQSRERLGRSRTSEILSAQSARASLLAQQEQLKGQLAVARETLSFLTGLDNSVALANSAPSATMVQPLEYYLQGIGSRPDVQAAALKSEAAHAGLWVARCALLPSLDLMGNYYLQRTGISQDIKWDAQLALTLPLFAGGANLSRIREAASVDRQGALEMSRIRRLAEQDIRIAYTRVATDLAQVEALSAAADLAERNYQEQSADYKLGLVTNIEVMQALASAQDSRRSFNRATCALKADQAVLETAAGLRNTPR